MKKRTVTPWYDSPSKAYLGLTLTPLSVQESGHPTSKYAWGRAKW